MRRLAGQAARHCGWLLHHVIHIALFLALLATAAVAAAAWRLSQGPYDLRWAAAQLVAQYNAGDGATRLSIGRAALAWEGFSGGVDRPLDLRVSDVLLEDAQGVPLLVVPHAEVSLSLTQLLLGRLVPRAIEIGGAHIRLLRAADGAVNLMEEGTATDDAGEDTGVSLRGLLDELGRPAQTDRTRPRDSQFSQLMRVRVRDATIDVVDRPLGVTWTIPSADIDLRRRALGGVTGTAEIALALGAESARLALHGEQWAQGTHVEARLSPVSPAVLARAAPTLAPLAALSAAISAEGTLDLDPGFEVRHARLEARTGTGSAHIGTGDVPLKSAVLVADYAGETLALDLARLEFPPLPGATPPVLEARGTMVRRDGRLAGDIVLSLNEVNFTQLPLIWPAGVGDNARNWVTQNITAGTARHGEVRLGLEAPEDDLSDVALTSAAGSLDGNGLTVWWLRPVPPIEHGDASLSIVDPDTIDIAVHGARQSGTALVASEGHVRLTGLIGRHQLATISTQLGGPIADAIGVLKNPRLHLFDKTSVDLRDPAGSANVRLTVSVPLEASVTMESIPIRAVGRLADAHLAEVVAGRDLDQGNFDLDVSNNGLKLSGHAAIARIPASLGVEMDFRAGGPAQVLQKITVSGKAEARQLAAAGLDPLGALGGVLGVQAVLTERRDGAGELAGQSDLGEAEISIAALGFSKPAGSPAHAAARIRLNHDRIVAIEGIEVTGAQLGVRGGADFVGGSVRVLKLDEVRVGATSGRGEVDFPDPASKTAPIRVAISGATIDLSARFARKPSEPAAAKPEERGRPWVAEGNFERVLLGENRQLLGASLHAENDGLVIRRGRLDGRTAPGAVTPGGGTFSLAIAPSGDGRALEGHATDAGALLRALDIIPDMEGGKLTLRGTYDDRVAGHPLSGNADIADFRLRNAPAMARLLQAVSLYGLVSLVQGPGLAFTRLEAPFRLTGDILELQDARVFSSSLGLTAKGKLDLARETMDMQGTIVPAYFFNSLLGNVPLVGRLFSPEKGGGVFAADYTVSGTFADPHVGINPLSALTPGFLRGMFHLF